MSYKQYQKVLDINVKSHSAKPIQSKKITKKSPSNIVKRRTKTGCLTCRKRKKKCDEDVVHGKCQGCTRNFLQCCWPGPVQDETCMKPDIASSIKSEDTRAEVITVKEHSKANVDKCSIQSLLATPMVTPTCYNPYPSPLPSPKDVVKEEFNEVNYIALPSNASINFKQSPIKSPIKQEPVQKQAQFIITSYNNDNNLCQISSN